MDKETPPCRSAGSRRCPRCARVRRVASKLALTGSRHRRDNSAGRGLRSALQKGKAAAGSASPLPPIAGTVPSQSLHRHRASGASVSGAAFGHDSSPRRGRVQALDLCCLVLRCLRLAVIGRVSPRRVTILLVATKKEDKNAPAAAPALAGALAPPASGGSRRNSPWRAQTSTRQFRRQLQGKATAGSPLPAPCQKFASSPSVRRLPSFRARHSEAIRRPGAGWGPGS